MNRSELIEKISSLTSHTKREMPLPEEWHLTHNEMISLIDAGILGTDGFQYCFVEYAKDCWTRCHHNTARWINVGQEIQVSKELLGEAIRDEKPLPKTCIFHPRAVWYDESECPCCQLERENPELTGYNSGDKHGA